MMASMVIGTILSLVEVFCRLRLFSYTHTHITVISSILSEIHSQNGCEHMYALYIQRFTVKKKKIRVFLFLFLYFLYRSNWKKDRKKIDVK